MSGEGREVESEIVLPDGMELVVPPPPSDENEPREDAGERRGHGRPSHPRPANSPPFVHRGAPRRARVA